jgi:hypothetical protein
VPALTNNRVLYRDGVPVAVHAAGQSEFIVALPRERNGRRARRWCASACCGSRPAELKRQQERRAASRLTIHPELGVNLFRLGLAARALRTASAAAPAVYSRVAADQSVFTVSKSVLMVSNAALSTSLGSLRDFDSMSTAIEWHRRSGGTLELSSSIPPGAAAMMASLSAFPWQSTP